MHISPKYYNYSNIYNPYNSASLSNKKSARGNPQTLHENATYTKTIINLLSYMCIMLIVPNILVFIMFII